MGTEVFGVAPLPPPVFVDASGARRRRMRWATYGVCLLVLAILVGFWVSLLAGPVHPPVIACTAAATAGCAR